jgi:endonuclease/exonuclease/phosphatase family metal-dependent hydrolase
MARENSKGNKSGSRVSKLGHGLRLILSVVSIAVVVLLMVLYIAWGPGQTSAVGKVKNPAKVPTTSTGTEASKLHLQDQRPSITSIPETNISSETPGSGAITVRIATWNVRDCAMWDARTGARIPLHDLIATSIAGAHIDVVVFEEVQDDSKKGGDIALLSVALAKAGWAMPYISVVPGGGQDDLAIFSRYRITTTGPVLKPDSVKSWPRPGIFASLEIEGKKLDIFGFHFKAMDDQNSLRERTSQAAALADYLRTTYGNVGIETRALVIAGDFNTVTQGDFSGSGSTMEFLELKDDSNTKNDFIDLADVSGEHGPTFVNATYRSVIDHIVISPVLAKTLEVTDKSREASLRLIDPPVTGDKIPASDHKLVLATLILE